MMIRRFSTQSISNVPAGFPGILLAVLIMALLALAGCGGDKEEPQPDRQSSGLVPAAVDTASRAAEADTGAAGPVGDEMDEPVGDPMADAPETRVTETLTATGQAAPPKARTTPAPTAPGGDFSLQVGSFRQQENAGKLAAQVQELGYKARVETAVVGGLTYHRVFVRGLADRTEAENLGEELRSRLGINYLVLRKP
jgi:DedD protein